MFSLFLCRVVSRQTHILTLVYSNQTYTQTQSHTLSSLMQPREVMKTNGRVLFPLGPKEELSHQANFILVWPRDSISSGCFYKRWVAPHHRPVMDMRAWWPDGRCWPCNSSSKHLPLRPMFLTQCNVEAWVWMQTTNKILLLFLRPKPISDKQNVLPLEPP